MIAERLPAPQYRKAIKRSNSMAIDTSKTKLSDEKVNESKKLENMNKLVKYQNSISR
jgi:hypothetical protein